MGARIKDIALAAKVDMTSVSRTLRNDPRASELRSETRERILRIARDLGYRPNISAATIRTGVNSSTVGIITEPLGVAYQSFLFKIIEKINSIGYGARVYCNPDLNSVLDEIVSNQIKYVVNTRNQPENRSLFDSFCRSHGVRMVYLSNVKVPGYPCFATDNRLMMKKLVLYLNHLGHQRIAYLCGVHSRMVSTRLRHQGFLDGIQECGIAVEPGMITCRDFSSRNLFHCMEIYKPTAICAIDCSFAVPASVQLAIAGIRMPQDISLAAFGSSDALRFYTPVPITTVLEPFDELIQGMLSYLLDDSKPSFTDEDIHLFAGEVEARASTAPPVRKRKEFIKKNKQEKLTGGKE